MSDEVKEYLQPGKKNLILIYALYLIGLLVPVFPLVGAAFAYANKEYPNSNLQSHYIFALRTFYLGVIGLFISIITTIILIGPFLYMVVFVWFVVRSIIALQLVFQDRPHPRPLTYWIM
jgi:uncharacterized membrane protein